MRACAGFREDLSAELDGELAPAARAELEAHLAQCPACRAAREELRATVARLRELSAVEPPDWLEGRILARVRELRPGIWRAWIPPLIRKPQFQVAALLLVGFLGILVARRSGDGPMAVPGPGPAGRTGTAAPAGGPARNPRLPEAHAPAGAGAAAPVRPPVPVRAPAPAPKQEPSPAAADFSQAPPAAKAEEEHGSSMARASSASERGLAKKAVRQDSPAAGVSPAGASLAQGEPSQGPADLILNLQPKDPATVETAVQAVLRAAGAVPEGSGRRRTAWVEPNRLPELLEALRSLGVLREDRLSNRSGTIKIIITW